jgi:hypothetical protein
MSARLPRIDDRQRRGNAMIVGLLFLSLLGFGALAVDMGLVRVGSSHLQHSLDSAAFSGVQQLDGSELGIQRAMLTAAAIASENPVMGRLVTITPADIQPGTWDPDTQVFTAWALGDDPEPVNALRIRRDGLAIPAALGAAAFGAMGYAVDAKAMAFRPWAADPLYETPCYLPLAIPDCYLDGVPEGSNPPPIEFSFQPTPSDNIAWGLPDGNPSSTSVRDQLVGNCSHDPISIDDLIYVNEGLHTDALKAAAEIMNYNNGAVLPTLWDVGAYGGLPLRDGVNANLPGETSILPGNYGNVIEGPVPLVEAGASCDVSFATSLKITGFAWGVIYDVDARGWGKNMFVQLDVTKTHEIWGGTTKDTDPPADNVLGAGVPQFGGW